MFRANPSLLQQFSSKCSQLFSPSAPPPHSLFLVHCNSVLTGLPASSLVQLQPTLQTAAKVIS